MAKHAAILGLDTAAGAYLARLLDARGYAVRGSGGARLLERLGIAGDVTLDVSPSGDVDELYDLRGDPAATKALLRDSLRARLFVAVDPGDAAVIADLAAARAGGRFVATGRVYPNESRLGPGTSPVARIVAAAAAATDPDPVDLATATDCGWTPEYVDAMWLMVQRPVPADLAIGSGVALAGSDVARVAATWFGRPLPATVPAPAAVPADPVPAHAALGWRAVTVGSDLVEVLCEGAAGP